MSAAFLEILFYVGIPLAVALGFLVLVWAFQYARRRVRIGRHLSMVQYRGPFLLAVAVLLAGLAFAVHVSDAARQRTFEDANLCFLKEAEAIETSFQELVTELVYPVDLVRSVVAANPDITRAQFAQFVRVSLQDGRYPGVRGVSYVERVRRPGAADGMVVKYIEPVARNQAALGQDLSTNPDLRDAARDAMRDGTPVLSPRVTLVQDELARPGFVYFMPIYSQVDIPATAPDRERLLRGWAAVPIVLSELMSAGSAVDRPMANFQLFDQAYESVASLMYDSELPSGDALGVASLQRRLYSQFSVVRPLMVADRVFYLRSNSTAAFEAGYAARDHLRIATIGSSLSVLAAMVLWLLLVGRARAIDIASGMTADLVRLALVARRTSNAVIFSDPDGLITWVNEGFSRITAYSAEDVTGRVRDDVLLNPTTDPHVLVRLRKLADTGLHVHEVVLCRRKNGQDYWAELEVQAIRDRHDAVVAYMTVQNDVTEEVKAKAALEIEKQRTEDILAGANVGTWESNLVTGESQWNDRWAAMMGFSRDEVQPNADAFWQARLHPDDTARMARAVGDCVSGASDGYSCDVRVRRKDGSWMWILSRAKVMSRQPGGRAEWIGGIHTDISEFKHVEDSLRDMESFLDRAGRIAGVGAWQVELRTGRIIFSDQTCIIHGVEPGYRPTREQALRFYPPTDRLRLEAAMDRAVLDGQAWDLELEFVSAHGEHLWVRQFGEVEFDDAGAVRLVGAFQNVTEDKKARLLVLRSGELLRGAIDAINEAFALYDPQDKLVFCNDKYRALFDKSADLMKVGATFETILRGAAERGQYPEAVGHVDEWVQQRLHSHRKGDLSEEQQTANGRWLKVIERKMPDGHLVAFRVDITELKMATAAAESVSSALAEERRRLQNILQGTNVGTWEWNVQTGEAIYNDQYQGLLGYTPEALSLGGLAHWAELIHPQDVQLAESTMLAHLRGDVPLFEIELRMRHRDGHWVWLLGRGKLARYGEDGRALWVYGTHMDITERKLAEQELAATSATLQNVLDSATDVGIICTGVDRIIQVFNRGAENLLGYQADDLIGVKTCSPFFDLKELATLRESLELVYGREPTTQEVFEHVVGDREQQEWTFIRKDGSRFIASLIFSPMRNAQGEVDGHLIIIYDVSKQKEYETSLRQAMVLAEQSSVAKSQFLANMSHEIRTPMNAILGMLQLLHKTALNVRQRDYTAKAEGAARSLLGLLNDILDFSKVEAGKMQLDPQPFLLEDVLSDLSVILSSNLGNKEVDLLFSVDPAIPHELVGDALRLKQILINLGGNAVKFTQTGQVVVRWTLLASGPERVRIGVAVQDSGIGIAAENQARIFEAFTQAEANTTRRFGGTGLGLVISTRLIRLMGGELELVSAVGKGSTFSFSFEFARVNPGVLLESAPQAPVGPAPRTLLVDDNADARASAASMMRSLGWEVHEADSGAAALELLRTRAARAQPPLDALFVDWQMPDMDGWETLAAVRQLGTEQPLPLCIVLSRHNRESLTRRSESEQDLLSGFMVKPLTAGMFEQTLAQAQAHVHVPVQQRQLVGGVAALPAPAATADATATLPLRGMRLLVVEDNLINQQVAQELLASAGAQVTLAENGLLGLAALDAADPLFHAVLMDLQMPVMDGLTATRRLRENPRYADLPVIAMTANAMAGDREECLQAGMSDHVGKPFDLSSLIRTLVSQTHWTAQSSAGNTPDANARGVTVNAAAVVSSDWPEGIDIGSALARMGGNQDLLARAFQAYVAEARGLLVRLQQPSDVGAPELKRELHSFKGLSATMGVGALAAQAAEAERQVIAGVPQAVQRSVDVLLQQTTRLLPTLAMVADQLQAAVQQPLPAHGAVLPRAQLEVLLAELLASNMRALDLYAELRQTHVVSETSVLQPLDEAMASLDFALAVKECEKLLSGLDASTAR